MNTGVERRLLGLHAGLTQTSRFPVRDSTSFALIVRKEK